MVKNMNIEKAIIYNADKMCNYYFYHYYKYPYKRMFDNFKNKNYKYFTKASMAFSSRDGFEPEKFIWSIMEEEKQMPQQLYKESNWKLYERNKAFFPEPKKQLTPEEAIKKIKYREIIKIVESIKSGVSYLKGRSVKEMLDSYFEKENFKKEDAPCDVLLFYFSKTYIKWYFTEFPDATDVFIKDAKMIVERHPKIINKIKYYLKDDYFGSSENIE